MFRYAWQEAVVDAAREFDPLERAMKLEKAEATVRTRVSALPAEGDSEERQALIDALSTLLLKKNPLGLVSSERMTRSGLMYMSGQLENASAPLPSFVRTLPRGGWTVTRCDT